MGGVVVVCASGRILVLGFEVLQHRNLRDLVGKEVDLSA